MSPQRRVSGVGTIAIILALVCFVALTRAFATAARSADEPTRSLRASLFDYEEEIDEEKSASSKEC